MTEQIQYPKIDLIERDAEIDLMREMSRSVIETGERRVLYFEAGGGLGKTRLLQDYPKIVAQDASRMLVADVIDMYDFENWRPIEIERKIVNSLRLAARSRIAKNDIDAIFLEYKKAYSYYHAIQGVLHVATMQAEEKLRVAFIAAINSLAQKIRVVLRFDTFEVVVSESLPSFAFAFDRPGKTNAVPEASTESYDISAGADIVLNWFKTVIPQLDASLVIIAGRPAKEIRIEEVFQSLEPEIRSLSVIQGPSGISRYLRAYGIEIPEDDDRIDYIGRITDKLPLLLTLYARREQEFTGKSPRNTYEFEDKLLKQTFNLIEQWPPAQESAEPADARYTFTFCLYILSCARRGIRRKDLRGIFRELGIKVDESVIDRLEDEMLIKTVHNWRKPKKIGDDLDAYDEDTSETTDSSEDDRDTSNDPENTLLLLHDEIQVLIDQGKILDDLHYRKQILDYLCDTSEQQVRACPPGKRPLKLLSDHMYYELTRDIAIGYRTYSLYVDWLLRQRYIQEAQILADVFWTTLSYKVERGDEVEKPFYDRLAESLQVSIDDIRREEGVRYVKRLRLSDKDAEAAARAEELCEEFANEGIVPADMDGRKLLELETPDYYVFIDLCLNWATAILGKDNQTSERLLSTLRWLLDSEDLANAPQQADDLKLSRHLAYLRRKFFLGSAYNMLGQLYDNKQSFKESVLNLKRAKDEMTSYQSDNILLYHEGPPIKAQDYLNDDIIGSLAHIDNNLAFSTMRDGKPGKALELSNNVIKEYITDNSVASTYQKALFYNTNATICIQLGEFALAKDAIDRARDAANQSAIDRAIGLVTRTSAIYQRANWNNGAELEAVELRNIDKEEFEQAAIKLRNLKVAWGELHHERARFARDLVLYFQRLGEAEEAQDYWGKAITYLDRATEATEKSDGSDLKRANLLETRATLYLIKGDTAEARRLLDQAKSVVETDESMPGYIHVVAGKIDLQRALIALQHGHVQEVLPGMASALARVYRFAPDEPRYREQVAFEKLIANWLHEYSVAEHVDSFVRTFDVESVMAHGSDLPYVGAQADEWLIAWERSRKFFQSWQRQVVEKAHENPA